MKSSIDLVAGSQNGAVPIGFFTATGLQLFNVQSDVVEESGVVYVDYVVRRSSTTIVFSVFVVVMMWLLSLSAFWLSASVWLRRRKVEPPTIAVTGALLFGLPALRNTQPAVPPIGTAADVYGFFFNMILISMSVLLLIFNYLYRYKAEKTAPKQEEQKLLLETVEGESQLPTRINSELSV